MKVAFTNFLTTLKRYKTASVLNIAGLTIAFIAFYILMAQVHYGFMYNSSIPDNDRVFVTVSPTVYDEKYSLGCGRVQTEMTVAQVPEVEVGGVITTIAEQLDIYKFNNGSYDRYELKSAAATPPALEALSVKLIVGDFKQFSRPNTVIISDRTAKLMKLDVGDWVYYGQSYDNSLNFKPTLKCEVVGIYKTFPNHSLFAQMDVVRSCKDNEFNKCYQRRFSGIVKLRKDANTKKFEELWMKNYQECVKIDLGKGAGVDMNKPMRLVALKDLYFAPYAFCDSNSLTLGEAHSKPIVIYSQLAVAILTILIAFINFVNFFFALIPVRIRAVNISKVFGASNTTLRWSFLFEALALTLISLALALYLMIAIQDSFISNYVNCSLALNDNVATIGWIAVIVVMLALTAALYPAWYITSFAPSLATKGRFGGSKAGQRLRIVLSLVQFTISMVLIIVTSAFWLQYRYMTSYDMGFDYENVVTFAHHSYNACQHNEAILEELQRNPMIEDVTITQGDIFEVIMTTGIPSKDEEEKITIDGIPVRYNFLQFFRIPVDGRDFLPTDDKKSIITAELKTQLDRLKGRHIVPRLKEAIGIIPGCRFRSINRPSVFYEIQCYADLSEMMQFYLRLQPTADYKQVQEYVKNTMKQFGANPDKIDVIKVEDQIADMYAETRNQTVILSMFSFASIIISLMGVFGIVIFETQYRRKEIAIRRVFGATTSGMLWMFNSRYVQIVVACFMVSVPVAYYIIQEWQKDFAHKAPIEWWVYVSALALVLIVTLSLVTSRSLKAAHENPAQVVKGE